MNIAICDDNSGDLKYIERVVRKSFEKININLTIMSYTNASELLNVNKNKCFDAVFLDIDMPDINGMEAASSLNKLNESTEIVFITNHDEFVYKAYRFKALGFIRKRFLENEIDEIIELLIESISSKNKYLVFFDAGKEYKFNVNDILFMQSDDHYVNIFYRDKKKSIRDSLNNIDKKYAHYGFIRVHSRYLVNYRYIFSIEKNTIVLNDMRQLPISRRKSDYVKEAFRMFSRRFA